MSMPKIPKTPMNTQFVGMQPGINPQVAHNLQAYEALIRSHGMRMVHSRPLPCPNRKDLYTGDHDPSCPLCHNGYLYYGQREFVGAFEGNSNSRQFGANGTWDLDQASIVIPTVYSDGTTMDVQFFDQVIIPDVTVRYYQLVEHSQTGIDRLHFPAKTIDKVVGADGTEYFPGVDVIVNENGRLQWINSNRPGYDMSIDRGGIYSVNYYCVPVFTIISLPHQLRITQTIKDGIAVQERFPQMAVCRKDFLPHDNVDKKGADNSAEPRDGSL